MYVKPVLERPSENSPSFFNEIRPKFKRISNLISFVVAFFVC